MYFLLSSCRPTPILPLLSDHLYATWPRTRGGYEILRPNESWFIYTVASQRLPSLFSFGSPLSEAQPSVWLAGLFGEGCQGQRQGHGRYLNSFFTIIIVFVNSVCRAGVYLFPGVKGRIFPARNMKEFFSSISCEKLMDKTSQNCQGWGWRNGSAVRSTDY